MKANILLALAALSVAAVQPIAPQISVSGYSDLVNSRLWKRGCCSRHGGVCGNRCCDGSPLSAGCR